MELDTLSVSFSADISPVTDALGRLSALLPRVTDGLTQLADDCFSAGTQAGQGLADGLLSARGAVAAAAQALAAAASGALRGALQIHSPSRVTYELGTLFDEGLASGIQSGTEQVRREAETLCAVTAGAASPDAAAAAPIRAPQSSPPQPVRESAPVNLTVPLEIDGCRLGMIALENINRLAENSGRVELVL